MRAVGASADGLFKDRSSPHGYSLPRSHGTVVHPDLTLLGSRRPFARAGIGRHWQAATREQGEHHDDSTDCQHLDLRRLASGTKNPPRTPDGIRTSTRSQPIRPTVGWTCGGPGGGDGEIRTHGRRKPSAVFKTAALNRSATSPDGRDAKPVSPHASAGHRAGGGTARAASSFSHSSCIPSTTRSDWRCSRSGLTVSNLPLRTARNAFRRCHACSGGVPP
jgi:hypothetical protein